MNDNTNDGSTVDPRELVDCQCEHCCTWRSMMRLSLTVGHLVFDRGRDLASVRETLSRRLGPWVDSAFDAIRDMNRDG